MQTVDFFTPIVDDAFTFGEIAAVNSLSDVYAMGGRPITALSIAGFPKEGVDDETLGQILAGGLSMLFKAGVSLVGGHTVNDEELKFGYAITGLINPADVKTNAAAQPGDLLVLTKPIGTGVIATGIKFDLASPEAEAAAIASMRTLNREAGEAMRAAGAHSATDITGFGLLGHAFGMARASGTTFEIEAHLVPLLLQAIEMVQAKMLTRGDRTNREHVGENVRFDDEVSKELRSLLFDPQTSGGLLISVSPSGAEKIIDALAAKGQTASVIGRVVPQRQSTIEVHA